MYYDRIAKQWHRATGHSGGAFKRYVLNDYILGRIGHIEGLALLELGAGNGYFVPLMLRRFSGQAHGRLVISDQSPALIAIAQATFRVDGAEYLALDVQDAFPLVLVDTSLDLILALMLFNELTTSGLMFAARECHRILRPSCRLIAAVPHPTFVRALAKKGALTDFGRGLFAMPSAEGLRLPVSRRTTQAYVDILHAAGFAVTAGDILPDEKTLREKPGLTLARGTPLGLVLECAIA